jgi:hypothetical protein
VAGESIPEADSILARAETAARERFAKTYDFFDASAIPDAKVAVALASEALPAQVNQLAALYAEAFKRASATGREIDSVTQQLASTASLLRKLSTGKGAEARAKAAEGIEALIDAISGRMAAAAAPGPAKPRAKKAAAAPRSTRKPAAKTPASKIAKKGT